ncbi:hypothetical protein ABK040_007069 [Willaertia magna]
MSTNTNNNTSTTPTSTGPPLTTTNGNNNTNTQQSNNTTTTTSTVVTSIATRLSLRGSKSIQEIIKTQNFPIEIIIKILSFLKLNKLDLITFSKFNKQLYNFCNNHYFFKEYLNKFYLLIDPVNDIHDLWEKSLTFNFNKKFKQKYAILNRFIYLYQLQYDLQNTLQNSLQNNKNDKKRNSNKQKEHKRNNSNSGLNGGGSGGGSGVRAEDLIPMNVKVAVIGHGGSGKTALTVQFVQNVFQEHFDPTIEDSYRKEYILNNKRISFEILDTSGIVDYAALRQQYMRSCECYIYVMDMSDLNYSFKHFKTYLQQIYSIRELCRFPFVICVTKLDVYLQKLQQNNLQQFTQNNTQNNNNLQQNNTLQQNLEEEKEKIFEFIDQTCCFKNEIPILFIDSHKTLQVNQVFETLVNQIEKLNDKKFYYERKELMEMMNLFEKCDLEDLDYNEIIEKYILKREEEMGYKNVVEDKKNVWENVEFVDISNVSPSVEDQVLTKLKSKASKLHLVLRKRYDSDQPISELQQINSVVKIYEDTLPEDNYGGNGPLTLPLFVSSSTLTSNTNLKKLAGRQKDTFFVSSFFKEKVAEKQAKLKEIKVAVLDSGIDIYHPDFADVEVEGKSFVQGEPFYFDNNGHGTHCAGLIEEKPLKLLMELNY